MRLLYHLPLSPFARKVRLVLAEKRLPFELQMEKVWQRRPEYLAINAAATVPTLVDEGGLAVADSAVICEYLDAHAGGGLFPPAGPAEKTGIPQQAAGEPKKSPGNKAAGPDLLAKGSPFQGSPSPHNQPCPRAGTRYRPDGDPR